MKILHVSDTHGWLDPLVGDADLVVHSGDFMPNKSFANKVIETAYQPRWVEENIEKIRAWLGGRRLLMTNGNHDYIDPTPLLRAAGMDATLLHGALEVDGVRFWGHPWTPAFWGWNWMCGPVEMEERLFPASERMAVGVIDVFVSHGPMYGVLDRNASGERCGCKVLRETMQDAKYKPKLLLHGHIHEANGVVGWAGGMIVSNAATGQRVLTLT